MTACYTESQITAPDGISLFLRRWDPEQKTAVAEVLVLHGYAEHSGRYRELAHALASRGLATTALDLRGHGRSDGLRGYVRRFDNYLDDVQAAFATLTPGLPHLILGHSNGALIALDFVVSRRPALHGLVVSSPFLDVATPPGRAKLVAARLAARWRPTLSLPSGIKACDVSHDPAIIEAYARDPMVFNTANASWFKQTTEAQARVRALTKLDVPLFYVYSGVDRIVSADANRVLAAQLQCPEKQVIERTGEYHEVLNEVGREKLHLEVADWMLKQAGARRAA